MSKKSVKLSKSELTALDFLIAESDRAGAGLTTQFWTAIAREVARVVVREVVREVARRLAGGRIASDGSLKGVNGEIIAGLSADQISLEELIDLRKQVSD